MCKEIIEDVWSRQRSWNRDNLTQEFYKMTKESMAMLIFFGVKMNLKGEKRKWRS